MLVGYPRRSMRAVGLVAVVAALLAVAARPAAAAKPVTRGSTYLALGDSITFGYQEPQVVPAPQYARPSSFVAYPELLAAGLRLKLVNAACPGETAASFVDASKPSNGCEDAPTPAGVAYRKNHPLHVRYAGSQLDYAVRFLKAHRDTRLVSLMIGANDLLLCQETTADGCVAEAGATLATVGANVRRIVSAIRHKARYRGQLAIIRYYSPNPASPALNLALTALNSTLRTASRPYRVVTADGFESFQTASAHSGGSPCTAGLLTQLGQPGTCGIHPSYAGQALLAQALLATIRL